ncbi:magnesium transporter [archaeon]|nr:magnesium transporter [archaeon]
MGLFDKNFKEMLSVQTVSVIGDIIVGILLAVYVNKLLLIPGMLLLLPGFLEMRGNISGTLSSRLSSGLFLGVIKPAKPNKRIIKGNLVASFALAFLVSLALGLIAFAFNYLILGVLTFEILLLPLIAGIIANAIEVPLALFATIYMFRKGHDPNNIMGPFITTTGDITSILALLIALVII